LVALQAALPGVAARRFLAWGAVGLAIAAIFTFPAAARGQTSAEPQPAEISAPAVTPVADVVEPPAAEPEPATTAAPEPATTTAEPEVNTAPPPPPLAPSEPAVTAAAEPAAVADPVAPAAVQPKPSANVVRRAASSRGRVARVVHQAQEAPTEDVLCVVMGPDGSCAIRSTTCDILGTDGDDTLTGTPAGEIICGLDGNDVLLGDDGEDTLVGGPGDDRIEAEGDDDCIVPEDTLDDAEFEACRSVDSFPVPPPSPPPPPPPPTGGGGGGGVVGGGGGGGFVGGGGGRAPGLVSQTTGAGQVYVALNRYLQAGEEKAASVAEVIAVILKSAVNYEDGELRFLVRCSYAGDGRVVLTALDKSNRRVKLGTGRFHCAGEGDDPVVSVEISTSGRRLLEGSRQVRVQARVVDTGLERQPKGSRQNFVIGP
jgi:hypothetical protein